MTDVDQTLDPDRVLLEQALRDVEVANARVIDLTQRLVDLTEEVQRLRGDAPPASAQAPLAVPTSGSEAARLGLRVYRAVRWRVRLRYLQARGRA